MNPVIEFFKTILNNIIEKTQPWSSYVLIAAALALTLFTDMGEFFTYDADALLFTLISAVLGLIGIGNAKRAGEGVMSKKVKELEQTVKADTQTLSNAVNYLANQQKATIAVLQKENIIKPEKEESDSDESKTE